MSNKNKKKFVPKSGNPQKRAKEIEEHKLAQERLIEKKRADKAYTARIEKNNYKPENVGGIYTPPDFITRIEQLEAPQSKPKGKADKRKIWGAIIGFVALGAMVASGMAGLGSAFSPIQQQQQQQQQMNNQQNQVLDENGNPVLVDVNGNPIDGTPLPNTLQNGESQVIDSQTLEIPADDGNPEINENNTKDK